MKNLTFILLFYFLTTIAANSIAQEFPRNFGIIDPGEIALKSYDKDPSAEAVVLFDIGNIRFNEEKDASGSHSLVLIYTRTCRIKILSEAGIGHGEVEIPLYSTYSGNMDKIKTLEAKTYNTENGVTISKELDKSTIYEEKYGRDGKLVKFAFPEVKVGSILEYKTEIISQRFFRLPTWYFQSDIPTLYSQFQVMLVPFYEYTFYVQGIKKFDYQNVELSKEQKTFGRINMNYGQNVGSGVIYQENIHTYAMKNIPAFKDETYITSVDDYIMKMVFQLSKVVNTDGTKQDIIKTWDKFINELLTHEDHGKFIKKCASDAKKRLQSELPPSGASNTERAKQIIEYVRNTFTSYNNESILADEKPKTFLTKKNGNTASINLYLIAMLREAGIEAHPVILSTRSNGKLKVDYPFVDFFNYVAVFVKDTERPFLTDGTNTLMAYNRIPSYCINDNGLLMVKGEPQWISLYNNILSLKNIQLTSKINPISATASVNVNIQANEYEAFDLKRATNNDTVEIRKGLLKRGFNDVNRVVSMNYDKGHYPYTIIYEAVKNIDMVDNKLAFSPFLHYPPAENFMKEEKRSYPIDFVYAYNHKFNTVTNIPEGYKVLKTPDNFKLDNELFEISLEFKVNETNVEATGSITVKKAVYQPKDYSNIKSYFNIIVSKFNQQIVFEKL